MELQEGNFRVPCISVLLPLGKGSAFRIRKCDLRTEQPSLGAGGWSAETLHMVCWVMQCRLGFCLIVD